MAAIAGDGDRTPTDLSLLLLEQAQILDGELPEDPAAFAARLNRLVLQGMAALRPASLGGVLDLFAIRAGNVLDFLLRVQRESAFEKLSR